MSVSVFAAMLMAMVVQAAEPEVVPQDLVEEAAPVAEAPQDQGDEAVKTGRERPLVTQPQAVVRIHDAVVPDEDFRVVEHGDIITRQRITPANTVTLTSALRKPKERGGVGDVLWQAVNKDGEWWCYRNIEGFPVWFFPPYFYCYQDADADGRFDTVRYLEGHSHTYSHSHFLISTIGATERMRGEARYVKGGELPYSEYVALRFEGPNRGTLTADGRIVDGLVMIEVLGGLGAEALVQLGVAEMHKLTDRSGMDIIDTLAIPLDAEGRGSFKDDRGLEIIIDRVNADGSALIKVVSGLNTGEQHLKEKVVELSYLELLMMQHLRRMQ